MNELSAKEKIKLKKKLKEKQALEPEPPPIEAPIETKPVEQRQDPIELKHGIEILHIYPAVKKKAKFIARGTLVVKINSIGLKVRNVPYSIGQDKQVNIKPPFQYHRFPTESDKPDAYVASVAFDDKSVWKEVAKTAKEAVLEHHCKEEK